MDEIRILPIVGPPAGELIMPADAQDADVRVLVAGRFRFFFSLDKSRTSPHDLLDSNLDGVPDFVSAQLNNIVNAYRVYVEDAGLPDFFTVGLFARKGLKFLDIVLDDLPVQRGLASASVVERTPALLRDTCHAGSSLLVRLHRGLPLNSLTPAHELFHVFQYATVPFLNMWFMEGLARHGQRWLARARPVTSPLPLTQAQLERVLRMWHDAEGFWNRLAELCSQRFVGLFLGRCAYNLALTVSEVPARQVVPDLDWSMAERRSGANNRHILRAISETVNDIAPPPHPELEAFLWLIKNYDRQALTWAASPQVQAFLGFLQKHGLAQIVESIDGRLSCHAYDSATGTLSIPEIRFGEDSLTDAEFGAFVVCRHIIGNLSLVNQPRLTSLDGLAELRAVDGDLIIENTGTVRLADALASLERVKGRLQISRNTRLSHLDGFNQLVSIDAALELVDNLQLRELRGFRNLEEIKKGALCIRGARELSSIDAFSALSRVREVELGRLGIRSLDFLENAMRAAPDFPGAIRITHCEIDDISALCGVRSVASSLYLHGNRLADVEALADLISVGASLSLGANQLENLHGLRRLRRVNGMLGLSKNRLRSLAGLEALNTLRTTIWSGVPQTLALHENPALTDIGALAHVRTEDDYLILQTDDIEQYRVRPLPTSAFHRNVLQIHQGGDRKPVPTYLWCSKPPHDYTNFRKATHNKRLRYIHDFENDAEILVLSFAGVNGKLGGVFHNRYTLITEGVSTHKIFISDPSHRWYHGGIPGLTGSMQETVSYLRALCRHRHYRKIVCIGASMGGYMALLVGHQLGATEIIAFSPQTFIDKGNRSRYGDKRWGSMLKHLPPSAPAHFLDLARLYAESPCDSTRIEIHYGLKQAHDHTHVQHLSAVAPVKVIAHDADTHTISIYLDREKGELNQLIRRAIVGDAVSTSQGDQSPLVQPVFSVVVPAYNVERYIEQCVRSVLAQSWRDFELIVVDDGSTDHTLDVLNALARTDRRIRIIAQPNQGVGAARNTGLRHARGRYVIFLDSDDWLVDSALSVFAKRATHYPDAIFCDRVRYDEKTGKEFPESTFPRASSGRVEAGRYLLARFAVSGKAFNIDFLRKHSLSFPEGMVWEDYPFSYGVLANAQSIDVDPSVVYSYRIRNRANPSLSRRTRSNLFYAQSRTRQISYCQDTVRSSGLQRRFPRYNFVEKDYGYRLLTDLRRLVNSPTTPAIREVLAHYAEFLRRNGTYWRVSVSAKTRELLDLVVQEDIDQLRGHLLSLADS